MYLETCQTIILYYNCVNCLHDKIVNTINQLFIGVMDETSQSSMTKNTTYEMQSLDLIRDVTAQTVFEYKWPPDDKRSEHYFLQEQVSEYLGVKSFKRRYPDVSRRKINHDERDFLVEMRAVNETQVRIFSFFNNYGGNGTTWVCTIFTGFRNFPRFFCRMTRAYLI